AVVADVLLKVARAARPKLRYTAGSLAGRVGLLRSFAPARLVDAGIRRDLLLDTLTASPRRTPVVATSTQQPSARRSDGLDRGEIERETSLPGDRCRCGHWRNCRPTLRPRGLSRLSVPSQ